jgi:hypothetical protein
MDIGAVLDPPKESWVDRLRNGHWVYLPKEKLYARIIFAWEPPEPGHRTGRIALMKCVESHYWPTEVWWVSLTGCGIDGSRILLPVADNLPDEPAPISDVWQRHVERTLAQLGHRLEHLETQCRGRNF